MRLWVTEDFHVTASDLGETDPDGQVGGSGKDTAKSPRGETGSEDLLGMQCTPARRATRSSAV